MLWVPVQARPGAYGFQFLRQRKFLTEPMDAKCNQSMPISARIAPTVCYIAEVPVKDESTEE